MLSWVCIIFQLISTKVFLVCKIKTVSVSSVSMRQVSLRACFPVFYWSSRWLVKKWIKLFLKSYLEKKKSFLKSIIVIVDLAFYVLPKCLPAGMVYVSTLNSSRLCLLLRGIIGCIVWWFLGGRIRHPYFNSLCYFPLPEELSPSSFFRIKLFYYILFLIFIAVQLTYNVMLNSGIQQSKSVIHESILFHIFPYIGYHRILSKVPYAIQ